MPDGRVVGSVIVNAIPGFNIRGKHKFNFIRRGDRVKVEYCRTCGTARRLLRIDGANVDYVDRAVRAYSAGWPIDEFDLSHASNVIRTSVVRNYSELVNNSRIPKDKRV